MTRTEKLMWWMGALFLIGWMMVLAAPAHARCVLAKKEYRYDGSYYLKCVRWAATRSHDDHSYYRHRHHTEVVMRKRVDRRDPVYKDCKERSIRAAGDDNISRRNAEISAQDRWSSTVEVRHGTLFSDIQNADEFYMECARKVPSSWTEKTQAGLGVRHFVCEVEATPCRPDRLQQDEQTRAKRRLEKPDDTSRKD
jgi:hypothetical protein